MIKFQVYHSYFFPPQYQKVKSLQILPSKIFISNTLFFISMDFVFLVSSIFIQVPSTFFPPPNPGAFFPILVCQSLISAHKICLPSLIIAGLAISFFLSFFFFFHSTVGTGFYIVECALFVWTAGLVSQLL